jgi:hypothetical protein
VAHISSEFNSLKTRIQIQNLKGGAATVFYIQQKLLQNRKDGPASIDRNINMSARKMPEGYFSPLHMLILLFSAFLIFGVPLLIVSFLLRRSDERARIERNKIPQIPGLGMPQTKSQSEDENA